MVIVKLKGGLGNQMFQYALGRSLSLKYQTDLKLDLSFFNLNIKKITKRDYNLNVFNIKTELAGQKEIPLLNRIIGRGLLGFILGKILKYIPVLNKGLERGFNFNENIMSLGPDVYLDGYWQSYKYFSDFEDEIKKDFTFKNNFSEKVIELSGEIKSSNSLCVHVRRGDYLKNNIHESLSKDYYLKGFEEVNLKQKIDKVYIFSDDINWCKSNLQFSTPVVFVGNEYSGEIGEGHMFLMSKCQNFIIANSTFSWWASWLSKREDKLVVVPERWFKDGSKVDDLIPEDWIKI